MTMPHYWEGIFDSSSEPERIWFTRPSLNTSTSSKASSKAVDLGWKPLRKVDCERFNRTSAEERSSLIPIDGGRMSADLTKRAIYYNFYKQDVEQELCDSFWFYESNSSGANPGHTLQPIACKNDCDSIEALYQSTLRAIASLDNQDEDGEGRKNLPASLLQTEIPLTPETSSNNTARTTAAIQYVAFLSYDPNSRVVAIRKRPASNQLLASYLESPTLLQRGGYGHYAVEGEEEEATLGPVDNLIFVVHGIGEAFFSKDTVDIPDMIDEMDLCRRAIHKRQVELWKKDCAQAAAAADGRPLPSPPNRIEILPILWYNRIHDTSNSILKATLNSITLPAVPELRMVANDIIFDVLMYLTPEYCQEVLEFVTDQITDLYSRFQTVHRHFVPTGGKCSIIGHSLGSVITWDLLSLLKKEKECKRSDVDDGAVDPIFIPDGNKNLTYIPSTITEILKTIPFEPKFTFLLGSPVGLFLTLRGANKYFEKLRLLTSSIEHGNASTQVSPFILPTESFYNIFHPSDPVAYRIEPLLLPASGLKQVILPPESLITVEGGVRTHMVLKQIGEDIHNTLKVGVTKLLSNRMTSKSKDDKTLQVQKDAQFKLGGRGNSRIDYMIQTGLLDDEYISAVSAHSTYFKNSDIIDFIIQKSYERFNFVG